MANTINDVALQNLAHLMNTAGRPLEILAARQARERAAQDDLNNRLTLQEAEVQGRGRLQESAANLEGARQKSLLELRNQFESKEKELDRANRLKEIDASANAYVSRLSQKSKEDTLEDLRKDGIEPKGKTIDEQLADGLAKRARGDYPKARGAVLQFKDYERSISDVESKLAEAQAADDKFLDEFASNAARSTILET